MAFEPCQELFQGVIVCIHADFRLGGLKPKETKTARGKIYLVENDVGKLLARYRRDFPEALGAARPAIKATSREDRSKKDGWRIDLFERITSEELEREGKLYSEVLEAWRQGNGIQGILLATKELALHPAREELHLLRSASVLVELGRISAPLSAI